MLCCPQMMRLPMLLMVSMAIVGAMSDGDSDAKLQKARKHIANAVQLLGDVDHQDLKKRGAKGESTGRIINEQASNIAKIGESIDTLLQNRGKATNQSGGGLVAGGTPKPASAQLKAVVGQLDEAFKLLREFSSKETADKQFADAIIRQVEESQQSLSLAA